jgi:hypothetical protein
MLVKFCYLRNRKEKHEGVKRHRAEAKEAIDLQDFYYSKIDSGTIKHRDQKP